MRETWLRWMKEVHRVAWLRRFTRMFFPTAPRQVQVRAGGSLFPLVLIPREHRAILLGIYELAVVQALEGLLAPGMVVVDGGAHIGFFTLFMAHRVRPGGRVVAFEIHPKLLSLLRQNAALAPPDVHVEIRPVALADRPGTRTIRLREGGYTSLKEAGEHPVTVTTLDDAFQKGQVDLVKLDVEGMEAQVLAGAKGVIRRWQPALVLELHDPPERFLKRPEIRNLQDQGYAFFLLPASPPEAPHLVGLSPRFRNRRNALRGAVPLQL